MSLIKNATFILALALMVHCPHAAQATTSVVAPPEVSSMPEHTFFAAPETDFPVRIKEAKPQTLHLDQDVSTVKVDDGAAHVTAYLYDPRSVILYPHGQGGAHITLFGKDGKPFMARYVVIADPLQKYVRIHQVCQKDKTEDCDKTNIYYCPNLCYETHLVGAVARQAELQK